MARYRAWLLAVVGVKGWLGDAALPAGWLLRPGRWTATGYDKAPGVGGYQGLCALRAPSPSCRQSGALLGEAYSMWIVKPLARGCLEFCL